MWLEAFDAQGYASHARFEYGLLEWAVGALRGYYGLFYECVCAGTDRRVSRSGSCIGGAGC